MTEIDDDGEEIPDEDMKDPELRKEIRTALRSKCGRVMKLPSKELLKVVAGCRMNHSRAQAVKRIVRRISKLLGKEAPDPKLLKWWASEMVSNLDTPSGMVRLGMLRTIAESIGLLVPGGGLPKREASQTFVPVVIFKGVEPKTPKLEKTEPKLIESSIKKTETA